MKIVDVNSVDTGNQSYKMAQAINLKYAPKHMSMSFISAPFSNYLKFPYMVKSVPKQPKWVRDWWDTADIIHGHGKWNRVSGFGIPLPDAVKVFHQHGRFGQGVTPEIITESDKINNFFRIVSTINLLTWVNNDESKWLPAPLNIKKFDEIKKKYYEPHDTIRIVHAPTLRRLKHTDLFLSIMEKIMKKSLSAQESISMKLLLMEFQKT